MSRMVHPGLQCAVEMRKGPRAAAEPHALAEVIPSLVAKGAALAHDTRLYRHSLSYFEIVDARADGGDDSSCLVAENKRRPEWKVADSPVQVVVY
jgi:hypothetical protein